ncbi:hypothetical protein [Henriciella aquimarina]|uniref:hypothetical protein n=1 Tax=Henriciella aquimarina TaxID=545261 RepID=UPI000A032005|nr:hypothetical protein [Henriciella aquimarina]
MFDARGSSQKTAGSLGFGLAVTGMVAALFFGVLKFPGVTGSGVYPVPGTASPASSETLERAFEDEATRAYVEKLQATFPAAARDLEDQIRRAKGRGADEVEIGLLVLQAGADDIAGSVGRLALADVEHVDALLTLSQTALQELVRSAAPYCEGSDLMMFASLSKQDLYRAVFDRVGHGAGLYEFGLTFNGILLDAIRDARTDPVYHGVLDVSDQQALQTLGLSLITKPEITALLTTEGKSRSEMDAVMANTNFCTLGGDILTEVEALPQETKARLWGEAMRQVESGNWRYTLYRYTGL